MAQLIGSLGAGSAAATTATPGAAGLAGGATAPSAGGLFGSIPSTVGANGLDLGAPGQAINFLNQFAAPPSQQHVPGQSLNLAQLPGQHTPQNSIPTVNLMQYLNTLGGR